MPDPPRLACANSLGVMMRTPFSDGAHLADALVSLLLGDESIAAAVGLGERLLHDDTPFRRLVVVGVRRSSMVLLYHIPAKKSIRRLHKVDCGFLCILLFLRQCDLAFRRK